MPESIGTILYRLGVVENDIRALESKTEGIPVLKRDVADLRDAVKELHGEVAKLRNSVLTAALTLAGSAVFLAATIWLVFK